MNVRLLIAALLVPCALAARADDSGSVPLFPKDGKPAGFVVRHWADVAEEPNK